MKRIKVRKSQVQIPTKVKDAAIENIYKVRAVYADMFYITVVVRGKTTFIRLTFTENIADQNKHIPVSATLMAIEDFQQLYNLMGDMLQNLRKIGRIE